MKYYTFYRESNDFTDILSDPNVKSNICTKIQWKNQLLIGFKYGVDESVLGFLLLKYSDDMVSIVNKDYTPIPDVDYKPIKST